MDQISRFVVDFLDGYIASTNVVTCFIIGFLIIILESIIPILPLALFVAFNVVVFGTVLGFFMSWIATLIGCSLSFLIFRKLSLKWLNKYIEKHDKLKKIRDKIGSISFTNLVIIMAFPFAPAFSINIAAGLTNMNYKKFIMSASISKIAIVYFWGYIGSTFLQSMTDIGVLLKLSIIIVLSFLLSKFVTKKFKID